MGGCLSRGRGEERPRSNCEIENGSEVGSRLEGDRWVMVGADEDVMMLSEEKEVEEIRRSEMKEASSCSKLRESSSKKHDSSPSDMVTELSLVEKRLRGIQLADDLPRKKPDEIWELHQPFTPPTAPFIPLTAQDEDEVYRAMAGERSHDVLVRHEPSNIEITGQLLQCLSDGAWLNDEIINLYLELLKERERRDPKSFCKCHFFNTFFHNRLTNGETGYDFEGVRRWTTHRKIGYSLIECDKIFVPIHKQKHWSLAIINIKDKKFQYLNSRGGMDKMVLDVLVRYMVDEASDKNHKQIDVTAWKREAIEDFPVQKVVGDCGMFMLKYIDFYSRGLNLTFVQEDMPYFRKRTAKEILRLRAE